MFRKPREAVHANGPHSQILPSVGRPPTPPLSSERRGTLLDSMASTIPPAPPPRHSNIITTPNSHETSSRRPGTAKMPGTQSLGSKTRSGKVNGNIMNFFQKATNNASQGKELSRQNSSFLFVDAAPTTESVAKPLDSCEIRQTITPPDELHSVDEKSRHSSMSPTDRFNEDLSPIKRRRIEDAKSSNVRRGPFLDDSDVSDREAEEVNQDACNNENRVTNQDEMATDFEPLKNQEDQSVRPERTVHVEDSLRQVEEQQTLRDRLGHHTTSAPPLIKEATSMVGDDDGFEGLDDFIDDEFPEDGEEYLERRWMEEQAELEMDAEMDPNGTKGDTTQSSRTTSVKAQSETLHGAEVPRNTDTSIAPADAATATCPICGGNTSGLTAEKLAIHVNDCIDGKAEPLDTHLSRSVSNPTSDQKPSVPPYKRFQKAAIARPGQDNPVSLTSAENGGTSHAFSKLMSGHAEDNAWAAAAAAEASSRGKPAYQRTCPFYKIMPGFFICVDAFRYGAVRGCHAYFLSHFHSDHYIGLTSSWCHGPIYCSHVTANLVRRQLRVDPKWVVDLEFERQVEVPNTQGVQVTMIPANHCPGSSLYLFEKTVGKGKCPKIQRVLHCGDFRACPAHVQHPKLRPEILDQITGKLAQQRIDVCYLDTTYLTPKYAFPTQEEVIRACADMCVSLSKDFVDKDDDWERVKKERAGEGMVKFVRMSSCKEEPVTAEVHVKMESDTKSSCALDATETPSGQGIESEKEVKIEDGALAKQKIKSEYCQVDESHAQHSPLHAIPSAKKGRGRLLVIVGTYSIGKERICLGVAKALNSKIYAPPGKQKIVAALEDSELSSRMTDDPLQAQVHMQMLMEIRAETLADYLTGYKPHFSRIVGFRPSGWNYRPPSGRFTESPSVQTVLHSENWKSRYSMADLVPQRGSTREANCFGVPYSEHSSFRELTMFCCALRIDKIIPTVNVGSAKSRERMKAWCEKWAMDRKKSGLYKVADGQIAW